MARMRNSATTPKGSETDLYLWFRGAIRALV
jgi:hypothetical protein